MTNKKPNVSILEEVADWLEAGAKHTVDHPINFDMRYSHRNISCGSVACIAGAIVQFNDNVDLNTLSDVDIMLEARSVANLTTEQSDYLFAPADYEEQLELYGIHHGNIDSQWAARTIRHFIKTGVVDWVATADIQLREVDYV